MTESASPPLTRCRVLRQDVVPASRMWRDSSATDASQGTGTLPWRTPWGVKVGENPLFVGKIGLKKLTFCGLNWVREAHFLW